MKAELINPFLGAAAGVYRAMLKTSLVRGKASLRDSPMPTHDIAIFLALSGEYTGQVVYSIEVETAKRIVAKLVPGLSASDFENEYRDIIGELGNMITGNALQELVKSSKDIHLDVPIVVDIRKQRPSIANRQTLSWNLYSTLGLLEVNVALQKE